MTVNPENLPHIIRLAEVMLCHETTKGRGTTLVHDLADLLLPEKAVVTETAAKPAAKPAPAPAPKPAPKPEAAPAPATKLQMTAKANGVTLEQYLATEGWTEELLIEQGLAERVSAAKPAPAPAPAPKPEASSAGTATLTPEELNNALVAEFRRLGSREGIDNAMAEFGVTSVNDLKPEQYQPLLEKVKAL